LDLLTVGVNLHEAATIDPERKPDHLQGLSNPTAWFGRGIIRQNRRELGDQILKVQGLAKQCLPPAAKPQQRSNLAHRKNKSTVHNNKQDPGQKAKGKGQKAKGKGQKAKRQKAKGERHKASGHRSHASNLVPRTSFPGLSSRKKKAH